MLHTHTRTPMRSLTHKCTQAREQITVGLQQWAILTHEKERRKKKKCVWKYPSLSLIRREKWLSGQSLLELAEYHLTFGLFQTANSTESYRAGKSLPFSQILPTHLAASLPPILSLYLSTLLLSLVPIHSVLSGTDARTAVGECPLSPFSLCE